MRRFFSAPEPEQTGSLQPSLGRAPNSRTNYGFSAAQYVLMKSW